MQAGEPTHWAPSPGRGDYRPLVADGWGKARHRSWPVVALVVGTAALVADQVWWLYHDRSNGAMEVDEAAYLATAFRASEAVRHRSWSMLSHLYFHEHVHEAPLLSVVAIPFHLVLGRSLQASLLA